MNIEVESYLPPILSPENSLPENDKGKKYKGKEQRTKNQDPKFITKNNYGSE